MDIKKEISPREERIRKITNLYYSRKDVQEAIFGFSKNREISPRYFEGFGKRPDSLQYPSDVLSLAKKGATSFHCSEELWSDPMELSTEMSLEKANELRIGWDLLIDIDCPWIDGSKYAAIAIRNVFKRHKVNAVSVKFSGSKGFHILVPFKTFPKEIAGVQTKNLFPELPRKLVAYLRFEAGKELERVIPQDFINRIMEKTEVKRGLKCNSCGEVAREMVFVDFFCPRCKIGEQRRMDISQEKKLNCSHCNNSYEIQNSLQSFVCEKCRKNSIEEPNSFSKYESADMFEIMGLDLVLVSPRHLFRMPYSLHEKTSLSSIVIDASELEKFDMTDAYPMRVKIKNFMPDASEGECKEFVREALDWYSNSNQEVDKKIEGKYSDFKPIVLKNLDEEEFPPCVKKILNGLEDGKKRALFVLINLFRSVGMEKERMEELIFSWNLKNTPSLKKGYVQSQLAWAYKRKPILPPNCREFYSNMNVCFPDNFCSQIKNPVNYVVRRNYLKNNIEKNSNKFKKSKQLKRV